MNFMWLSEMNSLKRLYNAAVVPVVVLDDAADAVPTAKALLAGGVDVMEITFRTAAAADSIAAVAKECPDMLVGAGTVITLEQCKKAVACGAKFIVSPGYSDEVVSWCVENNVAITPGCVTPTEIMAAMSHGLKVVKFFPANVYGGLSAMKALSGPFGVHADVRDLKAERDLARLLAEARDLVKVVRGDIRLGTQPAAADGMDERRGDVLGKTNSIPRAAAELAKNGFTLDESTAKYKGEKMVAVYLKQEFGGFAVHLLQK